MEHVYVCLSMLWDLILYNISGGLMMIRIYSWLNFSNNWSGHLTYIVFKLFKGLIINALYNKKIHSTLAHYLTGWQMNNNKKKYIYK